MGEYGDGWEGDVKLTTDGYYHERRGAVAILPAWLTPHLS